MCVINVRDCTLFYAIRVGVPTDTVCLLPVIDGDLIRPFQYILYHWTHSRTKLRGLSNEGVDKM